MTVKRIQYFEAASGFFLILLGFFIWWWSTQLIWILIYPQPLEKTLIEVMPFVFWTIGLVLIVDGLRRVFETNPDIKKYATVFFRIFHFSI